MKRGAAVKNLSDYEKELKNSPKAGRLMQAADCDEGRRLAAKLDSAALERAVKSGDAQELRKILSQVLSTPDGQALARKISGIMKD